VVQEQTRRVALVTGCGRLHGMGRGIALALAQVGNDLVVTDIADAGTRNDHEAGEEEARVGWQGLPSLVTELESLGVRALALRGDVGNSADVGAMVSGAVAALGRVDVLVNNAGSPHGAERTWTWEVPEQAYDEVMRINTKGVFLMSAAIARHLIERNAPGRIINIASDAGRRGSPRSTAYSASKFAVLGITQSMAQELAPHGVTVNAVSPGLVDTARQRYSVPRPSAPDLAAKVPVGRMATPADIARAVVFLADPNADYITGHCLDVNGGTVMR
jgi:NAD(P)-dependent dehydrogenase (short-subunit alcohol dehydrogenase family)